MTSRGRSIHILLPLCLLGFASIAAGQPRCDSQWPWTKDLHVAGRVGDREVRGYFGEAYATAADNGLFGLFVDPATWTPADGVKSSMFAVDGTFAGDCSLTLTEFDDDRITNGTWQLHFVTESRLEGRRLSAGGESSIISLTVVPRLDCSGRGPWRTFKSPRWPITFAYPSSWGLAEERLRGRQILSLVCPDPSLLVIGGLGIHLELDPEEEPVTTSSGGSARSIGRFTTFDGERWFVGDCDGPEDTAGVFCAHARKSTWHTMHVLQGAAGEHRLYQFAGGYAGQGAGRVEYMFLIGKRSVSLVSEDALVMDRLGSEGPVLFDGDDVPARLVRSIRPR